MGDQLSQLAHQPGALGGRAARLGREGGFGGGHHRVPIKATTLGVGCVLIASMIWFSVAKGAPRLHELLITLFLFLTAPVSAHLLIKAALKLGTSDKPPPLPD